MVVHREFGSAPPAAVTCTTVTGCALAKVSIQVYRCHPPSVWQDSERSAHLCQLAGWRCRCPAHRRSFPPVAALCGPTCCAVAEIQRASCTGRTLARRQQVQLADDEIRIQHCPPTVLPGERTLRRRGIVNELLDDFEQLSPELEEYVVEIGVGLAAGRLELADNAANQVARVFLRDRPVLGAWVEAGIVGEREALQRFPALEANRRHIWVMACRPQRVGCPAEPSDRI